MKNREKYQFLLITETHISPVPPFYPPGKFPLVGTKTGVGAGQKD